MANVKSLDKKIETLDAKISAEKEKMDTKVSAMQAKIDVLISEREELQNQIEDQEMQKLKAIIKDSGMTIDDVYVMLQK